MNLGKFITIIVGIVFCMSCAQTTDSLVIYNSPVDAELTGTTSTGVKGASILQIPGYFVWGASVQKGEDGKYHMLFSMWESGDNTLPFVKSWVLESKIGYAVSDRPDGDFEFQKMVLQGRRYMGDSLAWDAQMVHNPHLKKFNGRYYLYYIGSYDPGIQPEGSSGERLDKRSRVQQSQCIGVISFDSFRELLQGNFERPDQPLIVPRTRVKATDVVNGSPEGTIAKPDNLIVVNPSVIYHPNHEKYLLYFKGNLYEPSWKGAHGVAMSDTPTGPFEPLDEFMFDIRMEDGSIASTEDPFVWYSSKFEKSFAIVKDFSGRLTGGEKKTLALLESEDGIDWRVSENALFMNRVIQFKNGDSVVVNRLERPQLLLSNEGIPSILYAASSIDNVNERNDGSTFNVQFRLKTPK